MFISVGTLSEVILVILVLLAVFYLVGLHLCRKAARQMRALCGSIKNTTIFGRPVMAWKRRFFGSRLG